MQHRATWRIVVSSQYSPINCWEPATELQNQGLIHSPISCQRRMGQVREEHSDIRRWKLAKAQSPASGSNPKCPTALISNHAYATKKNGACLLRKNIVWSLFNKYCQVLRKYPEVQDKVCQAQQACRLPFLLQKKPSRVASISTPKRSLTVRLKLARC